jgi:Arc/MetJ-type ribon-helix-helix transcriptional regulator
MTSSMISVRIPNSLVDELKEVSRKDHYKDTSEAVRSIIRDKWLSNRDPVAFRLESIRKDILYNISKNNQELLIKELDKIRESIMERKDGK